MSGKPTEQHERRVAAGSPAARPIGSTLGASDHRAKADGNGSSGPAPALVGFEFSCPICGRRLNELADYCPHCHAHLPFGGTYSPGKTMLAKALSWALLVVFVGSMALLSGIIVWRMAGAARG